MRALALCIVVLLLTGPLAAAPRHAPAAPAPSSSAPAVNACFPPAAVRSCPAPTPPKLCDRDFEIAKIAWKYFENNFNPETGLVNAVDRYPSTTMWDLASSLAGTVAARELGVLDAKQFDDRMMAMLGALAGMKLYKDEAPNKAYNAKTGQMSDYANKPSDGIGYSALDLARLAGWLDMLGCLYPKYAHAAEQILLRWKWCRIVQNGQMYGTYVDPATKKEKVNQEGRLGYEQYGAKILARMGFDVHVSASYKNEFMTTTAIDGLPIAVDMRDPRKLGAYNYVLTESYALDAMESGMDAPGEPALLKNIFEVQKRRWQKTHIVTAVSEDNVDRPPYFVYNTIYCAGSPWNTITDTGVDQNALKSTSTKAALSLAALFPDDPYAAVLVDQVGSAYDPARGFYSGVYENGIGYNKAITANTNGIILEMMLYRMYGPLLRVCDRCKAGITRLGADLPAEQRKNQCLPSPPEPARR